MEEWGDTKSVGTKKFCALSSGIEMGDVKRSHTLRDAIPEFECGTEGEINSLFCSYSEILISALFWDVEWNRFHYY
jgi:hypothetical protein